VVAAVEVVLDDVDERGFGAPKASLHVFVGMVCDAVQLPRRREATRDVTLECKERTWKTMNRTK
jgi:hypothetical protein